MYDWVPTAASAFPAAAPGTRVVDRMLPFNGDRALPGACTAAVAIGAPADLALGAVTGPASIAGPCSPAAESSPAVGDARPWLEPRQHAMTLVAVARSAAFRNRAPIIFRSPLHTPLTPAPKPPAPRLPRLPDAARLGSPARHPRDGRADRARGAKGRLAGGPARPGDRHPHTPPRVDMLDLGPAGAGPTARWPRSSGDRCPFSVTGSSAR